MFKLSFSLVFIWCLFLIEIFGSIHANDEILSTTRTTRKRRNRFVDACSKVQLNQKLFDGNCYLENENIYEKINDFLNLVNKTNPNLSIDEFLRNHLFINTTVFFREKYNNNTDYINTLNGK